MEKFKIKIIKLMRIDGVPIVVFDIFVNDIKVGEAESEYSVFFGILMSKFQEFVADDHLKSLMNKLQTREI